MKDGRIDIYRERTMIGSVPRPPSTYWGDVLTYQVLRGPTAWVAMRVIRIRTWPVVHAEWNVQQIKMAYMMHATPKWVLALDLGDVKLSALRQVPGYIEMKTEFSNG